MSYWRCWRCDAANDEGRNECENCGAHFKAAAPQGTGEKPTLAMYREVPQRTRPLSRPDEHCPEPGCDKTVGEHIAEAKAIAHE